MSSNKVSSMEDIKLDPIVQTLTIIQLTYGVPSVVLMISFFILMRRTQIYSNSFYRLVQLDLLTNIFLYFNTWLGIRMAMHPSLIFILKFIEQSIPGFLTWCRYFTWWFMHIQFLTASVLSVHRITAILSAARYEKSWARYYFVCGILFALYSFLPSLLWFGFTNEVVILNGTLSIIKHSGTIVKATNVTAIFSVIYFIVIFSLGVVTSCMFTS
ncbi:Serpentine receptor class gamma [Caenorhabditis elegans]|uniref:Serpentine receptor class gamma n=1 Tax=Caenorhabditis elegans TaxID=6239 RepID=O76440_CAEEL|nr:Serpentine receptor class gamma [Caenorhabditis elegans]CCD65470.2 Serpentine receptor class gamma [Caenorhabditis elegans]|eukprot:NP_503744.3 Serpentine receptor class gamma [Caenorhabditis elegans]